MIREARDSDADSIAEIYNYYIRETVITFEEEEISGNEINSRMQEVRNSGFPWIVAEEEGKIIGYAYATKWNVRSAYRFSAQVAVYISNACTARGWGTELYDELFSRLKAINMHVVIGGITLPNDASVALHEKFGMTKVAHFKEVGKKFGCWLDVGYWQTILI